MGRLMKRLEVKCRNCNHTHVPHRLSARYHSGDAGTIKRRIQLCKKCGHFWQDSVFKKKRNLLSRVVNKREG
jgi:uncharacterized Zn finger protein